MKTEMGFDMKFCLIFHNISLAQADRLEHYIREGLESREDTKGVDVKVRLVSIGKKSVDDSSKAIDSKVLLKSTGYGKDKK